MEFAKLNNGVEMPVLGYGVYQTPADITERCVAEALAIGYRSIDTAQAYGNEEGVGAAVKKSGIPRDKIFLTTKVWISNAGEEKAAASIDASLKKLQTDYIDLLLIHQPFSDYYGTYRAMEKAYRAGKLRAIGISNFYPDRFIDLQNFCDVKPAVNQIETHLFDQQKTAHAYLEKYHCAHEAWAPLGEGRTELFTHPVVTEIASAHEKTNAQIALRFLLQSGVIVIPKSVHKERMQENFDVFDFTLSDEEMGKLQALDTTSSSFFSHYDPKTVEQFMEWAK